MLKIPAIKLNNYTKKPQQQKIQKTKPYKNDCFTRTRPVAFQKNIEKSIPEIQILPGVSNDFILNVISQIENFPTSWLKKFRDEKYKIILTPTLKKAYNSQKLPDPTLRLKQEQNNEDILAATHSEKERNFFTFCEKPAYEKFSRPIVNHELSHGVCNVENLSGDEKVINLISEDIREIAYGEKYATLTEEEKLLLNKYFFREKVFSSRVDEVIADTYAWLQGEGCYGSGLVLDVKNPNLMIETFSNLSEYLKNI